MDLLLELAAMKKIKAVLDTLPTDQARRRVLDYVREWAWVKDPEPPLTFEQKMDQSFSIKDISHE